MIANTLIILMLAVVFYTYVGYGLVVWVMLRFRKIKHQLWNSPK